MRQKIEHLRVRSGLTSAAFATVLTTTAAFGHDFWIEPSAFVAPAGSPLRVRLAVGEHFDGEPVERNPSRIVKFVLVTPAGEQPIDGVDGRDPAGFTRMPAPGTHTIAYRTNRTSIQLDAAQFNAYLAEEGLDSIIELRKQRGESEKTGREAYSRCAKALIRSTPKATETSAPSRPTDGSAPTDNGSTPTVAATAKHTEAAATGDDSAAPGTSFAKPVGLTLELIAENDPYGLKPGDELRIRLVLDDNPLAGAKIFAVPRADAKNPLTATTGRDGRVAFKLDHAGPWLIHVVHMRPAPAGVDADWESLWASLTFEAPAAQSRTAP